MWTLRNPLADRLMAGLASLGDFAVLGPAAAAVLGYLLWRKRWMASAHWLAVRGPAAIRWFRIANRAGTASAASAACQLARSCSTAGASSGGGAIRCLTAFPGCGSA